MSQFQRITPFLWFNDKAEEAINFYVSIFKNSKVVSMNRNDEGKVFTASFVLEGIEFSAINGGPMYKFTEAISLMVDCKDQAEVDELWEKLSAGGIEQQCGWLKDRYGLSWQIIPSALAEYLGDPDPIKSERVMNAMLQMKKIDIEGLKRAHEGN